MKGGHQSVKSDMLEPRWRWVRLKGAGAAAMTAMIPETTPGYTAARVALGDHKITFSESPGRYAGVGGLTLQSATMTDLKNFSVIFKDYDTTLFVIEFSIFNAAGTAIDLTTAQTMCFLVAFKETNL
jgi:hypothetical protein